MFRVPSALAHKAEGTRRLDPKTFIFFSLRPDSKLIRQQDRVKAIVLSILMGLLTLGLGHLACKIICEIKKHQGNAHVDKILKIAQKELGCAIEILEGAVPTYVGMAYKLEQTDLTAEEQDGYGALLPYMDKFANCPKDILEADVLERVRQAFDLKPTDLNADRLADLNRVLVPVMKKRYQERGRALNKQIESMMNEEAKNLVGLLALEQMDQQLRKEARMQPVKV